MIANQVIQSCIEELKAITKTDLCVIDVSGNTVAAATTSQASIDMRVMEDFLNSQADSQVINDYCLFKVNEFGETVFVISAKGNEDSYMIGKIAVSQIKQLMAAYHEKYDRSNFYQNLLMDNLLLVDITNRAKKLHIPTTGKRVVFLLETEKDHDLEVTELMKGMFAGKSGDAVVTIEEGNIAIVKTLSENEKDEDLRLLAETIISTINTEAMINGHVAYGTIVNELREVSKSYKEAKMSLEVGRIFYADSKVVSYNRLGIGRLIYQMPLNLCKLFLHEIFGSVSLPEEIDEEILTTVKKFLENNLNISEASRKLFVHRNTLVYRIEKLQKVTGLDMRIFEDAMVFDIALMVINYVKYMESRDF